MDKKELERRTKTFALRVIKFVSVLPRNKVTDVIGYQQYWLELCQDANLGHPEERQWLL